MSNHTSLKQQLRYYRRWYISHTPILPVFGLLFALDTIVCWCSTLPVLTTICIIQLTIDRSERPLSLVTVAIPKRELTTHWQTRQSRLLLIWNKVLNCVIFKEIKTINTVLWLFNVSWQITVLPQFKHVNRSSFHIYLKHEMNMNKHQKVFYFNRGTHHFSSLSPP